MKRIARIAVVGDFSPEVTAHLAVPTALARAAAAAQCTVEARWFDTALLDKNAARQLESFGGVWCVPGSPYRSMAGALDAIRFARESSRAFLGTCGGFQHAIIEFARNVLARQDADHTESNPAAEFPLINKLACSLAGESRGVRLKPGSRAARIYRESEVTEAFNCNYGMNPQHQGLLEGTALEVTGTDAAGEVRVVELAGHPFFVGTLFQPERSALRGETHPLITSFVAAAAGAGP